MQLFNAYEESLIGVDKINTVNAYYQRDINMGLNNTNTIIKGLKKLGYYDLNINLEEEKYLKSRIIVWIKNNSLNNLYQENILNIITDIKNSTEYNDFMQRANNRLERANDIICYSNDMDVYNFYSSLTLDELNYLGF